MLELVFVVLLEQDGTDEADDAVLVGEDADDIGATLWADYEMDRGWRQQWIAMHFGNDLQLNDFGYLSRNSTNYLHWEVRKRFTGLPEGSRYSSKDWRWRVSSSHNNHGDKLNDQFRMSREGQLRNGSYEYAQINVNSAGLNDTLLRGNGVARMSANFNTYFEYERPRKGNWAHETELEAFTGGLAGNRKAGAGVGYTATYFVSDAFSVYAGGYAIYSPDWLVWQREDLVGGFTRRQVDLNAGLDWVIAHPATLDARQIAGIAANGILNLGYRHKVTDDLSLLITAQDVLLRDAAGQPAAEADHAVMAIENSIAGSILPNYFLLQQNHFSIQEK